MICGYMDVVQNRMHMFESNDRYGATAKVPSMPTWR